MRSPRAASKSALRVGDTVNDMPGEGQSQHQHIGSPVWWHKVSASLLKLSLLFTHEFWLLKYSQLTTPLARDNTNMISSPLVTCFLYGRSYTGLQAREVLIKIHSRDSGFQKIGTKLKRVCAEDNSLGPSIEGSHHYSLSRKKGKSQQLKTCSETVQGVI